MVQSTINIFQAFGKNATYADDSARRDKAYPLTAANNAEPVLGRFYTLDSDGKCSMGGTGIQLGIALNNGMVATFGGAAASVTVPDGTVADVCSFGHVFVASATSFDIGYGACYDEDTGVISGYDTSGSVPANNVAITGAEFIQVAGGAGEIGILSLNGK